MNTHGHTVEEWRKICRANEKKHRLRHPDKVRAKERRAYYRNILKRKAYASAYRAKNREKLLEGKKKWQRDNWVRRQRYIKDYYAKNREQIKAKSNAFYHANKEKCLASQKAYCARKSPESKAKSNAQSAAYRRKHKARYAAHSAKRRALKLKVSVNPNKITEWMVSMRKRSDVKCYYCSISIQDSEIHFDHVIPLTKGGAHEIGNLAASCSACNGSKTDHLLGKWNVKVPQQVLPL